MIILCHNISFMSLLYCLLLSICEASVYYLYYFPSLGKILNDAASVVKHFVPFCNKSSFMKISLCFKKKSYRKCMR